MNIKTVYTSILSGCLAGFLQAALSAAPVTVEANDEWRSIDTADLNIKPGSALDLSSLNDHAPVGTYGRVIVNKAGKLAFEKKPDEAIRFRCAAIQPILDLSRLDKQKLAEFAALLSRQGYNMVRIAGADFWLAGQDKGPWKEVELDIQETIGGIKFIPERLDKLDYFIAELRKKGIYIYMEGMGSCIGYVANGNAWAYGPHHRDVAMSHLFGDRRWRNHWQAGATKLLTHVNPYTGLALRDDPAIAVFLFTNEQDLLPAHIKSTAEVLHPAWKKYLQEKYRNFDVLNKAWNGKYGSKDLDRQGGFNAVPPIDANVSYGNSQAGLDTTAFFAAAEKEMTEFYQQAIRKIGYKGLTTMWDFCPRLLEIPGRCLSPVASMHNYHAHPSRYITPGSKVSQTSPLQSGGNGFKQFGPTRMLNRPFLIMEYGVVFWNRYRHEQGLLFGAGAAFQDYDGMNLHAGPVRLSDHNETIKPFNNTAVDPINRASEVITAFVYRRGDVATAKHTVAFAVDNKYIFSGRAMHGFNDELSQLWAVARIGMRYQEDPFPQARADIILNSDKTSALKYQVGATGTEYAPGKVDSLSAAVNAMRRKDILPKNNLSDPDKGILQSDTGEITVNIPQGTMTVISPRFEGCVMKHDRLEKLHQVTVGKCSVPASIGVVSLAHDSAIADSRRLLVVFATDALNSGMKFSSPDPTEMLDIGKLPVLVQTGKLDLTIARATAPIKVSAYALKLNGERTDPVPCRIADGKISMAIDTAKLPSGPALFFELVVE